MLKRDPVVVDSSIMTPAYRSLDRSSTGSFQVRVHRAARHFLKIYSRTRTDILRSILCEVRCIYVNG